MEGLEREEWRVCAYREDFEKRLVRGGPVSRVGEKLGFIGGREFPEFWRRASVLFQGGQEEGQRSDVVEMSVSDDDVLDGG